MNLSVFAFKGILSGLKFKKTSHRIGSAKFWNILYLVQHIYF